MRFRLRDDLLVVAKAGCGWKRGRFHGRKAKKRRMPTINQLIRAPRESQKRRNKVPAMQACPQKRGVCTRVYTSTP